MASTGLYKMNPVTKNVSPVLYPVETLS